MFHFLGRKQVMKPAELENRASIAEIITLMQESPLPQGLSFATLASHAQSVVNKVKIKLDKPTYQVGDIVYLTQAILDVNWKMGSYIDKPFVITQTPVDTQKYKTYTLRLLDDPDNEDCWYDLAFNEVFFYRRQES